MTSSLPRKVLLAACAALALPCGAGAAERQRPAEERSEPIAAQQESGLTPATLCARAETLLQDGDSKQLTAARRLAEEIVRVYPSAACGHASLSRIYTAFSMRRVVEDDTLPPEAVSQARDAVRLEPGAAMAHAALAGALLADLQPEEASAEAETALARDPDALAALEAACLTRAARGDLPGAREAIDRALALHPDAPIAHHLSGNIHLMAGSAGEALAAFRNALLLSPEFTPARLQMAAALEDAGDLRRAGELFKEIIATHPEESPRARLYMARSLMKRSGWQAALQALEGISFKTHRGLSDGTILYFKGLCLEQLGREREALEALASVISGWPDATAGPILPQRLIFSSWEAMARILLNQRDTAGAAEALGQAIARPDAPPDLFISLAAIYSDYKLPDRGLQILEQGAAGTTAPRSAEGMAALHVAWARLAREAGNASAMGRMTSSLSARAGSLTTRYDPVVSVAVVRAFAIAGQPDQALHWLRLAVDSGYDRLAWMSQDRDLEPLTRMPEFGKLASGLAAAP